MMLRTRLVFATMVMLAGSGMAHAHPRIHFGIHFGVPVWRGYCWPPYVYYYRPYRPVVVERRIVVQPAPVVVDRPEPLPPPQTYRPSVRPDRADPRTSTAATDVVATDVQRHIESLRSKDPVVRRDAAYRLGRMKAQAAVYELAATLAGDPDASVRDAAARALGLIGSPRALATLHLAAKNDADRDVRRSAQFAIDVIETNHPVGR